MDPNTQKDKATAKAIAEEMNAEKQGDDVNRRSVHFLTGPAPEKIYPNKIELSGDISTVSHFLSIRETAGTGVQKIDKSRAVIIVNKEEMTILLKVDPEYKFGAEVKATLELETDLKQFHINENHTFTKDQLVKLIKFSRLFFDDATKHQQIVNAFMKLTSSVTYNQKDDSDERGNKNREYVKNVETNAPTDFVLDMPIFKGYSRQKFKVEICLDVTEGAARFWFQSVELHELMQGQKDQIFNQQIESFLGYVTIIK